MIGNDNFVTHAFRRRSLERGFCSTWVSWCYQFGSYPKTITSFCNPKLTSINLMIKTWHVMMESPKACSWKHLSVWEDHMVWKAWHCQPGPFSSSQGHPKMMATPLPPFHQPLAPGLRHAWIPSPDKGRGGRAPEERWGERWKDITWVLYIYICIYRLYYIYIDRGYLQTTRYGWLRWQGSFGISGSTMASSSSSSSSNSSSPPAHSSSEKGTSSLTSVPRWHGDK